CCKTESARARRSCTARSGCARGCGDSAKRPAPWVRSYLLIRVCRLPQPIGKALPHSVFPSEQILDPCAEDGQRRNRLGGHVNLGKKAVQRHVALEECRLRPQCQRLLDQLV